MHPVQETDKLYSENAKDERSRIDMSDQTFTSEECVNSTQHSIYTRRCFATGELCSKQTNVHKEREKLHKNDEINAFVLLLMLPMVIHSKKSKASQ